MQLGCTHYINSCYRHWVNEDGGYQLLKRRLKNLKTVQLHLLLMQINYSSSYREKKRKRKRKRNLRNQTLIRVARGSVYFCCPFLTFPFCDGFFFVYDCESYKCCTVEACSISVAIVYDDASL